MDDLIKIRAGTISGRTGLIIAALLLMLVCWFAVRSQIGNMLGDLTSPADPNLRAISDAAVRWAPGDPQVYLLRSSATGNPGESLLDLQRAVAAAPADYRWRVALARGFEQNDQLDLAEAEFSKAVQLAPNYAQPHWHLGNYMLRRERNDEAIAELAQAIQNHPSYRDQVYALLWDSFDHDPAPIEKIAGQSSDACAYAAYFLAGKGAGESAVRLWRSLSATDTEKYAFRLPQMATALYQTKHFQPAWDFASAQAPGRLAVGNFTNGSFERPLVEPEAAMFDWNIDQSDPKMDAAVDSRARSEGEKSLKLTFRAFTKPVFTGVWQTLVIEPSTHYEVIFSAKTEDLRTIVPVLVEVLNACENTVTARSGNISAGVSDWTQLHVPFTSGQSCPAINVRVFREACGEGCPMNGSLFLDDFKLVKR